jgi:hypothetical protein
MDELSIKRAFQKKEFAAWFGIDINADKVIVSEVAKVFFSQGFPVYLHKDRSGRLSVSWFFEPKEAIAVFKIKAYKKCA